jgi:predicted kinase
MKVFMEAQRMSIDKLVSRNEEDYYHLVFGVFQSRETIQSAVNEILTNFIEHLEESVKEGDFLKGAEATKLIHENCATVIDFCKELGSCIAVSIELVDEETVAVVAIPKDVMEADTI